MRERSIPPHERHYPEKSECDPKPAHSAASKLLSSMAFAAVNGLAFENTAAKTTTDYGMVEVSYPSFRVSRKLLETLRPNAGL